MSGITEGSSFEDDGSHNRLCKNQRGHDVIGAIGDSSQPAIKGSPRL